MDLEYRSEFWDDLPSREAFKTFLRKIHNLDLSLWDDAGFWDNAYTPFSYFNDGKVVSSICLYFLDAVIDGKSSKLVQISGVGTLPAFRNQGLNRRLTDRALDWAKGKHQGVFLFADEEATPFYQRCGFTPIQESQEYCHITPVPTQMGINQLDISDTGTLQKIHDYAIQRCPQSERFSITNPQLLMFHVLYTMANKIIEIPELNCLVFFDRRDSEINIYDIVGREMPTFNDLYPFIAQKADEQVNFHFHTDKLEGRDIKTRLTNLNNTFVKGDFPIQNPAFPFTSRA